MAIDVFPTLAELIGARQSAQPTERKIDGASFRDLLFGRRGAGAPHEALFFYSGDELQAVRSERWKLHFPHRYLTVNGPPGRDGKPANFGSLQPANIGLTGIDGIATRHGYRVESLELSLFDLRADPGERRNVAAAHPEVVRRLTELAVPMRGELGDSLTGAKGRGLRPPGRSQ